MKMRRMFCASCVAVFLAVAMGVVSTSCKNDDSDTSQESPTILNPVTSDSIPVPEYTVDSTAHYTPEQWADFIYGTDQTNSEDDELDDEARDSLKAQKAAFLQDCQEFEDSMANVTGQNSFWLIFNKVTYHYYSLDENGKLIKLSAFLAYGSYWTPFSSPHYKPLKQDNIMLLCPYTHTLAKECATKSNGGWEFTPMVHTYLYIMPDGEGFGDTVDRDQPYLNHNLQAKQIYNALVAGYDIYKNVEHGEMEKNWKLRVVGMSQGAGDAIAVHRLLETDTDASGHLLAQHWNFEYSYVCCGAYCPHSTVEFYYTNGNCQYPVVIPLVVKSMRNQYPEFAKKYPEERFYSQAYLNKKDEYDKIYKEKSMNTTSINNKMVHDLGDGKLPLKLEAIFSEEALNQSSDLYKDFCKCLDDQDLTTGWVPITKMYIIWSDGDVVTPPVNSFKLMSLFGAKCDVTQWSSSHPMCCFRFMAYKKW